MDEELRDKIRKACEETGWDYLKPEEFARLIAEPPISIGPMGGTKEGGPEREPKGSSRVKMKEMRNSVLEPPTVSAYDQLRRNRNWWAVAAIALAWGLGVLLFFQMRDNYRAGGRFRPHEVEDGGK